MQEEHSADIRAVLLRCTSSLDIVSMTTQSARHIREGRLYHVKRLAAFLIALVMLFAPHASYAHAAQIKPKNTYQAQLTGSQMTTKALIGAHMEIKPNCSNTPTTSGVIYHLVTLWDQNGHEIDAGVKIATGSLGEQDSIVFYNYPSDSGWVTSSVSYTCAHDVLAFDVSFDVTQTPTSATMEVTNKTTSGHQLRTGTTAMTAVTGNGFWITKNYAPSPNQTDFGSQPFWNDYGTDSNSNVVGIHETFESWVAWDGSRIIDTLTTPISSGAGTDPWFNLTTIYKYPN